MRGNPDHWRPCICTLHVAVGFSSDECLYSARLLSVDLCRYLLMAHMGEDGIPDLAREDKHNKDDVYTEA